MPPLNICSCLFVVGCLKFLNSDKRTEREEHDLLVHLSKVCVCVCGCGRGRGERTREREECVSVVNGWSSVAPCVIFLLSFVFFTGKSVFVCKEEYLRVRRKQARSRDPFHKT